MSPDEYKLLGSMNQKLDDLIKSFDEFKSKATSQDGFTRCAVHRQEVRNMMKSFRTFKWMFGAGFGIPIIGIAVDKIINWIR